jgi:hypothetical protein
MSIVALAVGFHAIQWNRAAYLGKSPEQIVAMGRDKWFAAYTKKYGDSTMAMCEAETSFGDALKNLNDRALKRVPSARRAFLESARYHCTTVAVRAHEVGYAITGGGTIWRPFFAGIKPNVEQLIADSILNKPLPMIKMKSIESRYEELEAMKTRALGEMTEESGSELKKAINEFKYQEGLSRKFVESATEHDRTRLRLFVHKQFDAAISKEMMGGDAQTR